MYGIRRTKNDERIIFFDLYNAKIISEENNIQIFPNKYAEHYGDGFYENITACGLHKIDIEGIWQAFCESNPADSLAGKIIELNNFCQTSLSEFKIGG